MLTLKLSFGLLHPPGPLCFFLYYVVYISLFSSYESHKLCVVPMAPRETVDGADKQANVPGLRDYHMQKNNA